MLFLIHPEALFGLEETVIGMWKHLCWRPVVRQKKRGVDPRKSLWVKDLDFVEKGCACMLSHFSCVRLFVTLWTMASQALLSMGFSRQENFSGLPCLPPGDLPNPEISLYWCNDSLWTQQLRSNQEVGSTCFALRFGEISESQGFWKPSDQWPTGISAFHLLFKGLHYSISITMSKLTNKNNI